MNITVEEGTNFHIMSDSYIYFGYWDDTYCIFIAIASEDNPIIFTSASPCKKAGDWKSLNFYRGAIDCEFDYCEFSYGGANEYYGMLYMSESQISIINSTIKNSASYGIKVKAEFFDFFRNTFTSNALSPIFIYPNGVSSMALKTPSMQVHTYK